MRYLSLREALFLHRSVMKQSGGIIGIRSPAGLESALAQPRMTFQGSDLYPTIVDKAAALCFSIITNHPFLDGNKRTAHAAMEVFLLLNGYEVVAEVDDQEEAMLRLAEGKMDRHAFTRWLNARVLRRSKR